MLPPVPVAWQTAQSMIGEASIVICSLADRRDFWSRVRPRRTVSSEDRRYPARSPAQECGVFTRLQNGVHTSDIDQDSLIGQIVVELSPRADHEGLRSRQEVPVRCLVVTRQRAWLWPDMKNLGPCCLNGA
ncbi:hypothetical protein PsYK624_127160 [Phanerochaete sordida]|uniref:Uncharacterized protein n=1 Tax=Phanerochaete sordida TaxID=48140 RepID=A0A9P3LJB8_9APHY|nr:hypothetical protein PsYK624_127160 [Phanerochaete sordida]